MHVREAVSSLNAFGRKWLYGTQLVPAEVCASSLGVGEGDEIEDHVLLPVTLFAYVHDLILELLDQKVAVLGGEDDIVLHISFRNLRRGASAFLWQGLEFRLHVSVKGTLNSETNS